MTLLTVIDSDDLPPAILTPWTLLPTPTKLPLGWYEEGLQRIQELFSGDIPSWWFAGQVETSHFADWNSLPWWNCTFDQEHPILRLLSDEFLLGKDSLEPDYVDLLNAAPNSTNDCYE
jgi:hypothetical protein